MTHLETKATFNNSTDLDKPQNYGSDDDVSNPPLCQRTDQFITFRDVNYNGFGFLHKLDDFVAAFRVAIWTNRTLIDYTPCLTRTHNFDLNGKKRQKDLSTSFVWKFSNFFDVTNLHFVYSTENVS